MHLPNGNFAILGNKIESYCLNPHHEKGKHKAVLFEAKLGITINNAHILKKALKKAAVSERVKIVKENEYGTHYNMKFNLQTDVGESLNSRRLDYQKGRKISQINQLLPR
ncbi:DUF6883 domain-containing protein [Cyanobacterium sp. IPPAS B-1200]|uniref:DUF6883 domain-containing protein n=1 Tax=Cyanobacterium sp. IPPAS B-1200 TaxID=1562720 RepID=UPI001F57F939|nr:DUF6883 domain-containing protein [Cyanobacterium sp. IPPAS B-1200]